MHVSEGFEKHGWRRIIRVAQGEIAGRGPGDETEEWKISAREGKVS